jgi:imidazolonepropionase-like amidohydrolase
MNPFNPIDPIDPIDRIRFAASRAALLAALAVSTASTAFAQASPGADGVYIIRGGTVVTGTGEKLPNTSILIRAGRIAEIGASVATPAGAKVVDATGKFVYPGMIDSYTGIGLQEIGGVTTMTMRSEKGQFNPQLFALVGLNVESEMLGVTRMNGVTTVMTAPAGGMISGQAALINTAGWTWEDLSVKRSAGYIINLPGANGGRGGRGGGGRGGAANAGTMAELEQFLQSAKDYNDARAAGSTKMDLLYESLRPLFRREIPAIIAANDEQAIRNAVQFGDKWNIRVVISGGREAYKVRTLLAQKNVPVILSSLESSPDFESTYDEIYAQPSLLNEAGVKFAFSTGSGTNARHVPFHAALAVAYGLPEDAAMKALTIWPAEIFGAEKEIGSIAQGKLANLFVATGDPLDFRSQITEIFIKGRDVPDDDRHHRLYEKYKARPQTKITP